MKTSKAEITSLSRRFQDVAEKYPHRIAVRDAHSTISYGALLSEVHRLSQKLKADKNWSVGIGVVVDLEKTIPSIILILSILRSGGHYIPVSSLAPFSRVREIINISKSRLYFTDSAERLGICEDADCEAIYLPDYMKDLKEGSSDISEGKLAYIIFTSGSEGKPKGVEVSHKSIRHVSNACYRRFFVDEGSPLDMTRPLKITLNGDYSFDVSVIQSLSTLLFGHELLLIPEEVKKDLFAFEKLLGEERPDVLEITPTQLKFYIRTFAGKQDFYLPPILINVGEALNKDLAREIFSYRGVKRVINAYGPTESCVYSHIKVLDHWEDLPYMYMSIGKPIEGLRHYILDDRRRQVPRGTKGELWLESPYLSEGYSQDREGTDRVFFPSPFRDDARMYKTGDIAVEREDGDLVCLGRMGSQVKIHGQRLELGEIEALLRRCDGIEDAKAVICGEDDAKEIVVFCQGEASSEDLNAYLKENINKIFLPGRYIFLKTFPVNSNGKVDGRALKERLNAEGLAKKDRKESASRSKDIDTFLREEFEILTGKAEWAWDERIPYDEIDSLDIFLLSSHIYRAFGREIHPRELLECDDLSEISALIRKKERIRPEDGSQPLCYEMNHRQAHMWTHEQRARRRGYRVQEMDGRPEYSVVIEATLSEKYDLEAMERGALELIARHDLLHSKLERRDDAWVFVAVRDVPFTIDYIPTQTIENFDYAPYLKDFDLKKPPLFQIIVAEDRRGRQIFYFHFHHIISDPLSVFSFIQEWVRFMEGIPLAPLLNDYFSFMAEEKTPNPERVDFWKHYLKGRRTPGRMKLGKNESFTRQSESHEMRRIVIKDRCFEQILARCKAYGISRFVWFMSVFYTLIYRQTGEKDLSLGAYTHGRDSAIKGISHIQGLFVSPCPIRICLDPADSLEEKLKAIDGIVKQILIHQGLDVFEIYRSMETDDRLKGKIMDVVLNYLEDRTFVVAGTSTRVTVSDMGNSPKQKVDYINIRKRKDRFEIDFSLPGRFYTKEDADRIVEIFWEEVENHLG